MNANYFDAQHMAMNTVNHHQIADVAEMGKDDIPKLVKNDTSEMSDNNMEEYIQYNEGLETIPEESNEDLLVTAQGDSDDDDTIPYIQGDSEDEQFNTAIDDTSDDPMIVMGKLLTTTFVAANICIPTKKVGCLQVTNRLREFLIHFPPKSKEKAFEQIYEILQVLNAYLIDNPQQHIHCMSPDNEYVSLIMYTITIKIDLCNFLAIWAVLSILLDTQSNTLPRVKSFQQVVNKYYDKRPADMMSEVEQQASSIMKEMYDSINNEHSDSISGELDRVSDAVDSDYDVNDYDKDDNVMPYDKDDNVMPYDKDDDVTPYDKDDNVMPYDKDDNVMPYDKDENVMPYDKDENVMPYDKDENVKPYDKDENVKPNKKEKHEMSYDSDNQYMTDENDDDKMPAKYDNDSETVTDKMKYVDNMNSYELIDVGKKDIVTYNRISQILTKEKRPIETKDIDDDFMRKYDEMYKSMEYKQTHDYYEAHRYIQSTMEGDTPTKTSQNRQCIDNVRDYDREYYRILNSVCHTLELGPKTLPGALQYTTVESAAALSIQKKLRAKMMRMYIMKMANIEMNGIKGQKIWYLN